MTPKGLHEKFVLDENGKQVGVLIDIRTYRRILEELEELEAIRAYDAAKDAKDDVIPFDQAAEEIERSRR